MRFEDEHYVKLYTRDTPTWKAMCWQAKALLPNLFRKLDPVGAMECADLGRVETVSVMTDLPAEVVEPALKDLERLRVIVWKRGDVLLEPKFIEAQEARKTDKLRKAEEREKARAVLAAQESGIIEGVSEAVQPRPLASETVTHGHSPTPSPSPSPSPSPENTLRALPASAHDAACAVVALAPVDPPAHPPRRARSTVSPKEKPPVDPRLMPLRHRCVELYERVRGEKYPDKGAADTEGLKRCLVLGDDEAILSRFERGLRETKDWRRIDYLAELYPKWGRLAVVKPDNEQLWSHP